ncbi:hypothetical protein [Gimesia fumaroli]|uniref:Uncharacterized protein n=1 Tax=Gimesia fumaroli TaxID=2527976 RepID=A0A518I5V3_9PLAN|nr:hypothetical protein [Gimesia fumaroli]QDV48435.1 hypothetical protein Enr17x_04470 [Gimesia fumaroli]
MPNSNPVCVPATPQDCKDLNITELGTTTPFLCLSGATRDKNGPIGSITLKFDLAAAWEWDDGTSDTIWTFYCSSTGWRIQWLINGIPGFEEATGGNFPNIIFPNFGTTGGWC